MTTPKYIRVAGQLYRRREVKHPKFIRVGGSLYRLAQTGTENVEVVGALEKLAGFVQKIAQATAKDPKVSGVMNELHGKIMEMATNVSKGEGEEKKKALTAWPELQKGLQDFVANAQKANLPKLATAVTNLVKAADDKIKALTSAEGLDFVGKELGGETPQKTGVDWGEHATPQPAAQPQKQAPQQQQKMQASVHPQYIRVGGHLYRLA